MSDISILSILCYLRKPWLLNCDGDRHWDGICKQTLSDYRVGKTNFSLELRFKTTLFLQWPKIRHGWMYELKEQRKRERMHGKRNMDVLIQIFRLKNTMTGINNRFTVVIRKICIVGVGPCTKWERKGRKGKN